MRACIAQALTILKPAEVMADGLCVEGEGYETRCVLEKMLEEERLAQVCLMYVMNVMYVMYVMCVRARRAKGARAAPLWWASVDLGAARRVALQLCGSSVW